MPSVCYGDRIINLRLDHENGATEILRDFRELGFSSGISLLPIVKNQALRAATTTAAVIEICRIMRSSSPIWCRHKPQWFSNLEMAAPARNPTSVCEVHGIP